MYTGSKKPHGAATGAGGATSFFGFHGAGRDDQCVPNFLEDIDDQWCYGEWSSWINFLKDLPKPLDGYINMMYTFIGEYRPVNDPAQLKIPFAA